MFTSNHSSTFPLFQRLPTELRDEIWRMCLPRRVIELDFPLAEIVFDIWDHDPILSPCRLGRSVYLNTSPPLITRICRESRRVAFEHGRTAARLISTDGLLPPAEIDWHTSNTIHPDYWQPKRGGDLIHLN